MQQQTSPSLSPKKSVGTLSKTKTAQNAFSATVKPVQAEDNWDLTANPTKYLDQLPQPFRFINNLLDLLIMRPVFNQITLIEEQKKTTEYEGFLKEVQATGFVDQSEGVTCLQGVKPVVVGPGGKIDKEASQSGVANKIVIGNKFGQVELFDASRKLMLDKKALYETPNPRQIISLSTATLVWLDTKLTYVSVIARANPVIKILIFKHSENKFYHIYNLNSCPNLPNPDQLDANPDQSYLDLPSEAKLSSDAGFLAITTFGGEVKLIKLPAIINPFRESDDPQPVAAAPVQAAPTGKGQPAPAQAVQPVVVQSQEEKPLTMKPEVDSILLQNLEMSQYQVTKIEARKEHKFKDPFVYIPNQEEEGSGASVIEEPHRNVIPSQQPLPNFKYALGAPVKDTEGGDAGLLPKRTRFYPQVNFLRSKYCTSAVPSAGADPAPSARQVKEYFITTGLVVAYLNHFDIQVYNIQRPSKEQVLPDLTMDYFNKVSAQKKVNQKKKQGEKTLSQLIKTVRQKEMSGSVNSNGDSTARAQETELQSMREFMSKPARTFKLPYMISAIAFQNHEDLYQCLAVGLVDGAIVILDLILGIERSFLEKHPGEITTMAFWEDKVLISGSVDGRVNVQELESQVDATSEGASQAEKKIPLRCQNCQDRKIPVARVISSEYGIAAAVDIEGNCRFYDMVRQRKIAKVSSLNQRESEARFVENKCKWRLLPNVTFEVTSESFLAVTQTLDVPHPDGSVLSEKDTFIPKKFADAKENLKSLGQIAFESAEVPFYHQKSTLCIFRFEDVIFSLFPQMSQIRKKGMLNLKDIFLKNDPMVKEGPAMPTGNPQNTFLSMHSGGDARGIMVDSGMDFGRKPADLKSVMSGTSHPGKQSTVNFTHSAGGTQSKQYDIPTLKRLNPELYKEIAKQQRQVQDPIFTSVQHLKERYSYHEMRVQRIQKRTEEVTRELEAKRDAEIAAQKKKRGMSQGTQK